MDSENLLSKTMTNLNDEISTNHGEMSHKLTSMLTALDELQLSRSAASAFVRTFNNEIPEINHTIKDIEKISSEILKILPSVINDYKELTKLVGELSILKEVLTDEYKIENLRESLSELKYEHKQKQTTLFDEVAELRNK